MKTKIIFLGLCFFIAFSCSSDESDEIKGSQSEMGKVGVEFSSSSVEIAGVSNVSAQVVALDNGVSQISGEAKITNQTLKNMASNFGSFISVNGDIVTVNLKYKITKEGVENLNSTNPGILVKYDSKVGDTYSIGSTGKTRKVISKSTSDDYDYGFYQIKVVKVEEANSPVPGVQKIIYVANHKFGIVGVEITFDDGSTYKYPIYCSTEDN